MYQLSWPSISWPCSAPHQKLESQVPRPPPCSDSLSNSSAKLYVMSEMSSSNSNCSALISSTAVSEKASTSPPPRSSTASLPCWSSRAATLPKLLKRSEEHTSELQSLMRISYAVFCLKKK